MMKLRFIFISLVIVAGIFYLYFEYKKSHISSELVINENSLAVDSIMDSKTGMKDSVIAYVEIECIENSKYFGIYRKNLSANYSVVRTDILVKNKQRNVDLACEYTVAPSDFEIKSEAPNYIYGFQDDLLFVDTGTAVAPRQITIYDLVDREQVFSAPYVRPLEIKESKISYWQEISEVATKEKCVDVDYYLDGSMVIETTIRVDLDTFEIVDTGIHRCRYHE